MTWVKLDDNFFANEKVRPLSKDARLLYIAGLTYAARYLTDGLLDQQAVREAKATVDVGDTAVAELVQAGMWREHSGLHHIHDYLKYNPSSQKVREQRKAAQLRMEQRRSREHEGEQDSEQRGEPTGEVRAVVPRATRNPLPVSSNPKPVTSAEALLRDADFIDGLRERFTGLDFDYECQKWRDHVAVKPPKGNWKNSLRNWMERTEGRYANNGRRTTNGQASDGVNGPPPGLGVGAEAEWYRDHPEVALPQSGR